jgi:hypothetical protein
MITSYAKSISKVAQIGAKLAKKRGIDCGKMCKECAFKWNQPHTLYYFIAADNAANALLQGGEFNCHTHDYKDAGRPCAGFLMAKQVDIE